ncbi:hypothetical protein ACFLRN_09575 [Thermoproteota archaeon]
MKPKYKKFGKIGKGDLIVYYATKDSLVVGIFKVVSRMLYLHQDSYWGNVMVYKIEPYKMPPQGKYLDFKKLVNEPKVHFKLFPVKKRWGSYIQGKTCILLSEMDYNIIENSFSKESLMKNIDEVKISTTRWHDKYGKDLEKLLVSISDTEKEILKTIMSYRKDSVSIVNVKDLMLIPAFKDIDLLHYLIELRRMRLLKFMKLIRNRERVSITTRGRAFVRLMD